jgi:GNAT superfamily N-acetyltransferase
VWDELYSSMHRWYRLVGTSSDGASVLEREGVVAAVVPAAPERSVVNAVSYERGDALAAAYDEIAAAYDEIGAKWTVWVHHDDGDVADLLERRGHVLDAEPHAMARSLDEPPARPELDDWSADGALADVGAINDRAYPFGDDSFSRALTRLPAGAAHVYVARWEGRPAACLATIDHAANSEVQMVAVVPEARGHGLSGKLLAHALADAAERGRRTSTLIATRLGRPVYQRHGFRALGTVQMWERRRES